MYFKDVIAHFMRLFNENVKKYFFEENLLAFLRNFCYIKISKESKELFMELAKLTSKGQITIPLMIRNLLKLKTGDKIFFVENSGKVYITNASNITLSNVQNQMQGEAEKAGFQTEDDVVAYIKELRKTR